MVKPVAQLTITSIDQDTVQHYVDEGRRLQSKAIREFFASPLKSFMGDQA